MLDKFLKQLAEAFVAAGFEAKVRYESLLVNKHKFDAETEKNGRIKFLGSGFKVTGNEDDDEPAVFDTAKAVGLVMAELPKRIAAAKLADATDELWISLRHDYPEAKTVAMQDRVYTRWLQVGKCLVRAKDGKVEVLFAGTIEEAKTVLSNCPR